MIKKTFLVTRVSCIYNGDLEHGVPIDRCKDCSFFNGYSRDGDGEIIGVDCIRSEIPSLHCHVTSFTMGEYLYTSRDYDESKDGPLKEAYNYCEKCCFSKDLSNGKGICLLRSGVRGDIENFICYEGEIWEKKKKS